MFAATWHSTDVAFVEGVVDAALVERSGHPKPRSLICLASKGKCIGAVVLVQKRGGAAKGLLLRVTDNRGALRRIIEGAEARAVEDKRRKLYFLHPLEDRTAVALLREAGYLPEGLIREPYTAGQDVIILSRFLD